MGFVRQSGRRTASARRNSALEIGGRSGRRNRFNPAQNPGEERNRSRLAIKNLNTGIAQNSKTE
jgi:hypothetical protein